MKINVLVTSLWLLLCSGCALPQYLPYAKKIGENTYGSYIKLDLVRGNDVRGELIAVFDTGVIVFSMASNDSNRVISIVPFSGIENFKLYFARPLQYEWAFLPAIILPVLPFPDPDYPKDLMPFHGFFAFITLPVNTIAAGIAYSSAISELTYSDKSISHEELKMFARYPQGLPAGVSLIEIGDTKYQTSKRNTKKHR